MKIKFLIGIILSSLIVFNIFKKKIEGLCDFTVNNLDKNGNIIPGSTSSELCQNTTIYENKNNSKDAEEKLNELKNIVKKTRDSIKANTKQHQINLKNNKAFADVAAGNDPDTSAACAKYPKACPDYTGPDTSPPSQATGTPIKFQLTSLR